MTRIPTITELYNQILSDLEAEFSITIPVIGKSFLRALAAVQAGKLKLYYLAIGNLQKNIFADTADPESVGGTLERFGRVKLNRNPFPARAGQYELSITGTAGAVITSSTTFKSNDDSLSPGKMYVLDEEYTLTGSNDLITVRALEAGTDSALNELDKVTATAPILNVESLATVNSITEEPAAAEETEDYRDKVVTSYRLETQGGAPSDYRLWSLDAQGVERVYPYARSGETAVMDIYVEATIADSTDQKGTPSQDLLDDVEEVVETDPDTTLDADENGRRPMGAFPYFLPVTPKDVNITISDYVNLTTAIEDSNLAELESQLAEIRPFVGGADILDEKNDILDTNRIIAIILSVKPGAQFGAVTLEVDGNEVVSYQFTQGDIPYLNLVTYD